MSCKNRLRVSPPLRQLAFWFLKWAALIVGSGFGIKFIDYPIEFNKEIRELRRDKMRAG